MKQRIARFSFRSSRLGSTLLEALVALAVISIGLLAALQLQMRASQVEQDSRMSSIASIRGAEIMDAIAYGAQIDSAWNVALGSQSSNATVANWLTAIQTSLPNGAGSISCSNSICTIIVQWAVPGQPVSQASYLVKNDAD